MVRVPGSFGDSGYHRESLEEVRVKQEQGDQASSDPGSTTTPLNEPRSADRQSFGRNSADGNKGDLETDLEDKPQHPPQVPSGAPADLDPHRDSPNKTDRTKPKAKPDPYSFATPLVPRSSAKKKKSKTTRKQLKAPEAEAEDNSGFTSRWTDESLEHAFYSKQLHEFLRQDPVMLVVTPNQIGDLKGPVTAPPATTNKLVAVKNLLRLLEEAGLVAGAFDPNDLFDLDLNVIGSASLDLFNKLKALVGEVIPDPVSPPPNNAPDCRTASSHYASAEELGSDSSSEPQHMSLGPSGASMLEARSKIQRQDHAGSRSQHVTSAPTDRITTATSASESTGRLESYFQAAMKRFLAEQRAAPVPVVEMPSNPGSRDVDMESVGSRDHNSLREEYDPDDLDFPVSTRAMAMTSATGSTGPSMIQRVRISAISDLKEFTGKDQDEDRARAWISKVKSAFQRDQASDEEKCLTFGDLLAGSAKNWYKQLGRSTRNKWSDLLRNFQTQYCGLGVSVARQYSHARRRSDESPLDYLYRLNVAGLRARLKVKDGESKDRREHVDHFIETLGDPDLADRLTLFRLADADELEDVLRALERAKNRQKRAAFGSSKFRQKASSPSPAAPAKQVRAIQLQDLSATSNSGSDGSDDEGDLRQIYLAARNERSSEPAEDVVVTDPTTRDHGSRIQSHGPDRSRCSHCGSRKHLELDCWKIITCEKCGKRGHPADHCLFVCRGCGELHDIGKCPMEEFYNQIRQWYNPKDHAGLLPEMAEKMLN